MEQEKSKKNTMKNVLPAIIQAAGTFFYVFLMMLGITTHMTGLYTGAWMVPYFSLPAYLVCVTIAIDYWIAGNPVRQSSYLFSVILSVVILIFGRAYVMPSYVHDGEIRSILSVLFTVGIVWYSIRHLRKKKAKSRQVTEQQEASRTKGDGRKTNLVRIICLLSICCVLFENVQSSIMVVYGFVIGLNFGMGITTFDQYPLAILTAILLARFVKAEFAPREISAD